MRRIVVTAPSAVLGREAKAQEKTYRLWVVLAVCAIAAWAWRSAPLPEAFDDTSFAALTWSPGATAESGQFVLAVGVDTSGWATRIDSVDDAPGATVTSAGFVSRAQANRDFDNIESQIAVLPRSPDEDASILVVVWEVNDCRLLRFDAVSFSAVVSDRLGRSQRVWIDSFGPAKSWIANEPEQGNGRCFETR